jgi:hypothetical protein
VLNSRRHRISGFGQRDRRRAWTDGAHFDLGDGAGEVARHEERPRTDECVVLMSRAAGGRSNIRTVAVGIINENSQFSAAQQPETTFRHAVQHPEGLATS